MCICHIIHPKCFSFVGFPVSAIGYHKTEGIELCGKFNKKYSARIRPMEALVKSL